MNVRIYSDLHLEFAAPPDLSSQPAVDLVILAGDIGNGTEGVRWAKAAFRGQQVVYVMGNHEYYGGDLERTLAAAREEAAKSNVLILECDMFETSDYRVLGCTLWTDFELLGPEHEHECRAQAMNCVSDYRLITNGAGLLRPSQIQAFSRRSRAWLESQIAASHKPAIVVTHHCPSAMMRHPDFPMDAVSANFYSNYDSLIRDPIKLWVTGHTHYCHDLLQNGVRLVSHQRGYPGHPMDRFSWDAIFDIPL